MDNLSDFKVETIDMNAELQTVTGFITNDKFCKACFPAYSKDYIQSDYAKIIMGWVHDYYREFGKAPGVLIRDMFDDKRQTLKEEQGDIVEEFLESLSDDHVRRNDKTYNTDYHVSKSLQWFKSRSLEILFTKGTSALSLGRLQKAQNLLVAHKEIAKKTSGRLNPLDTMTIRHYDIEAMSEGLFSFPGAMGDLVGQLDRGWLVSVQAVEKTGKSNLLQELVFSALTKRLKVLWISLEMSTAEIQKRFYARLTGRPITDTDSTFPVFDCMKNQDGSCLLKNRTNKVPLKSKNSINLQYEHKYKPCTFCRGNKNNNYVPAVCLQYERAEAITNTQIERKAKNFAKMYGNNLRLKCFPRFSASLDDIRYELADLETSENFVPDVIVCDYLDILKASSGAPSDGREKIDYIWKSAAGIAGQLNCVFVTADQANAAARDQRSITINNFTEAKSKDSHVDVKLSLNQTPAEKRDKALRVNVLFHRHKSFHPDDEVLILQELCRGQGLLDSEPWHKGLDRKIIAGG